MVGVECCGTLLKVTSEDKRDVASAPDVDAVVVGAGFAGLYLHHRLRELGFTSQGFDNAADVGGTWYWNRYPGARCDVESIDYSYSFDPELEAEWEWSERYATQPEILRYAGHVADRHDIRRHIRFNTRVSSARWDETDALWRLNVQPMGAAGDCGGLAAEEITCRFYVMATGCLSVPKLPPDIAGVDRFAGDVFYTGRWPHDEVDFTGKRVAVIGTGSSGVQSIPLIAKQADHLTVYQRTPNFSLPAHNGPVSPEKALAYSQDRVQYREAARWSRTGVPVESATEGAWQLTDDELNTRLEEAWTKGTLFSVGQAANDILVRQESNDRVAEFVRDKIRATVDDPEVAEVLCPKEHPIGAKRTCLDTDYYATYNRDNVTLVNLKADPISSITETGIDTASDSMVFDVIVLATGFDAMTGPLVAVDIEGRDGVTLKQKWADGPLTYLGLTIEGFPNLFTITGPGSPSVLSNMMVSVEQHVEWVTDVMADLRAKGFDVIEATAEAEAGWVQHTNDCADITLFPKAKSWYMGSNVPGKPSVFLPYVGGVDAYRQACNDVVEQDYLGFNLSSSQRTETQRNDGLIRRLQRDVEILLQVMSEMDIPPIDTMTPVEARELMVAGRAAAPPGPEVGEIVDGVYPISGAGPGELSYRLFRPATPGPHPVVLFYHGGGWVLGSHDSNDPLCRDLCARSDSLVVSVDYRHAPEHPFPAAVEDAWTAFEWVTANLAELGGHPSPIVLSGWSAGGNLAAVVSQQARDLGRVGDIAGLVLLNPAVDTDMSRPSYIENGEGYVLTANLMNWFWGHYTGTDVQAGAGPNPDLVDDVRLAPLRGDLTGLPPAVVVTAEFDPLRDEGIAYVEALRAAGVDAEEIPMRGHLHTSVGAVDVIVSSASIRAQVAEALRALRGDRKPN